MADKDIVATIRKRDAERPQKLCDAIARMRIDEGGGPALAIAEGLDFLVADYRETAELVLQSKQRGGKAMADDRRTVAAALALLAVELRKPANKATAETYRQAVKPRPKKRCGESAQHEAHTWTEWSAVVEGPDGNESEAHVWACPGWSEPPRDLSGLKALIAERSGKGAELAERMTIDPAIGPDFTGGDFTEAMQQQFQFDEPTPVEDMVAVHLDNRGGTFAIDEPPPPGQAVALGGEVLTWDQLRGIKKSFQGDDGDAGLEHYGLPVHVSHSQIGTFSECALKGLLTRSETLGVEQLPQWANVGGTAVHLAVERFELMCHAARQVRATVVEQLKAAGGAAGWWASAFGDTVSDVTEANPHAPMETWRASKQGKEGYTWWLVEGEGMFQRYVTARMAELEGPWRSPLTMQREGETLASPMFEHEFVMDVEGVPFKGVIDQAWRVTGVGMQQAGYGVKPDDIVIDDVKSGSTPSDPAQLREYATWLALSGALGKQGGRIWGRFIDVRGGEIASAPFILLHDSNDPAAAGAAWDELAFKVGHTDGIKRSGSFMPRKNNYCVACPVKHACPIMASVAK